MPPGRRRRTGSEDADGPLTLDAEAVRNMHNRLKEAVEATDKDDERRRARARDRKVAGGEGAGSVREGRGRKER